MLQHSVFLVLYQDALYADITGIGFTEILTCGLWQCQGYNSSVASFEDTTISCYSVAETKLQSFFFKTFAFKRAAKPTERGAVRI